MEISVAAVIIILILVILSLFFVWVGSGLEHLCPDPAKIKNIQVTPETLQEGVRSFKWTSEKDRNYVGLDRCKSGINYYGKKGSPFECENTCKSDPFCDYWTYNAGGYKFGQDSIGECRGHDFAANNELPYTTPWPGFVSGSRFLGV
jgi:hypothetical protein